MTAAAVTTWIAAAPYASGGGSGDVYYNTYVEESAPFAPEVAVAASEEPEWLTVGVYDLLRGPGVAESAAVMQLAVDRGGTLRGSWVDASTGAVQNLQGQIDYPTATAVWRVEGAPAVSYLATVADLTSERGELSVVGVEGREAWTLVRQP